ncbi:MAG TPA: arginine--tRNA ligase [Hungateiclostridium thermocellum]|jgi:arginyl-tRNA synthetase|uniref:Arginine--tRNA ligase n=2 Tax=Acetivibrio thermocellus TaxID=1515 RepID=SYR_ACET2|nr:arginine--tRNA ligase [Acetivibrio thermocellus]A3DGS4.1 RecName: Full=Arginine--tRNA ligase; AltName: Full=Arginyl-tRNA synthetase; Short=ArgRS [Acetivibrio thermocellus ATCC 27405]ABN53153.1 arginyl-tRNA synthetase [Acetivibrio thermocellus ATCC 27405]ADU75606.1 arginyl-tRNA synthetase [Acetivibrio thermocellus DSM 1313]ALX09599.1 Arginyl-tRNA synthetase [Acetivibrio thermocellus AD2]ANV77373.1 Arginyl-tRNA synthetase [Acetivibrio thermocellus DSM 2360]EIC04376.1 arginyl-tRNA synthetase 
MTNVVETIKKQINEVVKNSISKAVQNGELPQFTVDELFIEIPKEKGHGDFSTNIAMQAAKTVRKAPRQVAEIIIKNMDLSNTYIDRVEAAGPGFINFFLTNAWLYDVLKVIQKEKENYGNLDIGRGQKVMVEFVSANPTGPLHMGNARGGALGDCIASVLEKAGYDVTREFYINDAGNQIEKFGISLEARYIQLLKGEDAVEFPEDGYHGEDIIDHMKAYIEENGDNLLYVDSEERRKTLVEYALPKNIERIRKSLENYGVVFDVWFSEQSLYDNGEVRETLDILKEKGYTFEKDGAVWFKASALGAEKDEVIVRNNGIPTYFAADIAYHRNKFLKRKFDRVINLLGADHHGHAARMKCALKAFDIDPDKLDIVIFQLVRLYRNGEIARMSKRTGRAISLDDLLEEVGRDAARFFFNTKASGSHLDFDLDLAVKKSNENPVYYVQYAYARSCSMLRLLESEGFKVPDVDSVDLTVLKAPEEIELMKKLSEYPEEIRISAQTLEPSRLTRYVLDVASNFHSFYNACRVKGEEENLMYARMILVDSTRLVIKNVLDVLSITAPEKM